MKAVRKTIEIAGKSVDVFQVGDEYVYSLTSVAGAIGKTHDSAVRFLTSKWLEGILDKAFQPCKFKYENLVISAIPSTIASLYWTYWVSQGSAEAIALSVAVAQSTLDHRAKLAFGIPQTTEATQKVDADNYEVCPYYEVWTAQRCGQATTLTPQGLPWGVHTVHT